MKSTIIDLLEQSKELLDVQPEEVKESLYMLSEYQEDTDIKTLKEYMENMEVQYSTYSHS